MTRGSVFRLRATPARLFLPELDPSARFFYAFGNQPPDYLFCGLNNERSEVAALCLAAGDLRSILYSLWREPSSALKDRRYRFVHDDSDARVQARNLLLLDLLLSEDVPLSTVWAVWYSLRLNAEQSACARGALERLAALGNDPSELSSYFKERHGCSVGINELQDWKAVQHIFGRWKSNDIPTTEQLGVMREAELRRRQARGWGANAHKWTLPDYSQSVSMMTIMPYQAFQISFPMDAAMAEVRRYTETGTSQPSGAGGSPFPLVNFTLQDNCSFYALHYASLPFLGYPQFPGEEAGRMGGKQPLLSYCMSHLGEWRDALLKARRNLEIVFSTRDCLELCQDMRLDGRVFQTVSTSNIADYVGLLPLLVSSRGLVQWSPGGTCGSLLTSSFLYLNYSSGARDYLSQNLVVDPAFWPSLIGWRPLGYESGDVAPESSMVQFEQLPQPQQLLNANEGKAFGGRAEFHLRWLPAAPGPLLPLSCAAPEGAAAAKQLEALLDTCSRAPLRIPGLHTRHAGSALGVLLRARDWPPGLLAPPAEGGGAAAAKHGLHEVAALADLATGKRPPGEFVCASLRVPREAWRNVFLGAVERQPVLQVVLSLGASGGTGGGPAATAENKKRVYTCLWMTWMTDGYPEAVHWMMAKEDLEAASQVHLRGELMGVATVAPGGLVTEEVKPEDAADLGRLLMPQRQQQQHQQPPPQSLGAAAGPNGESPSGLLTSVTEDKTHAILEFRVPEVWQRALESGYTLTAVAAANGYGVQMGIKGRGNKAAAAAGVVCPADVPLPFPVTVTGSRVLLSRKRWAVSLHVPKSSYPFASFALQRYQSKREGCLVPSGISSGGLVVISGLQASTKERFLISSRGPEQKPALVGLKETAMVFLQCSNEPMYQLATKELGVAVLVFNHGLLQDHCSGVPWADLSVCVLRRDTMNELMRHWSKSKSPIRIVNCSPPELELFKEFDRAFQQQMKGPEQHPLLPKWARRHFHRMLFPPLMMHVDEMRIDKLNGGAPGANESSREQMMDQRKAAGNAAVKAGRFKEAIGSYEAAIVVAGSNYKYKDSHEYSPGVLSKAVASHLNIAHCCIKLCEQAHDAEQAALVAEAIVSCDFALENSSENSVRIKGLYRKGLALLRGGQNPEEALAALEAASLAQGGTDAAISGAIDAANFQLGR